jgi:hypothetical protein
MFIQNRKRGRVSWSSVLASMALSGGLRFAFGCSLLSFCFVAYSFQSRFAQGGKMAL